MNAAQIKEMQRRIGTVADGFWGPNSIYACRKYLRSLMPKNNPWPASDQKSLSAFYGNPGDESRHVSIDVTGLGVLFEGKTVQSILCHECVAASLNTIIRNLASFEEGRIALSQYAGVYNNRPMRGGSLPSLHARAAAIDLMPATNRNKSTWPVASNMPLSVMEVFARHGWTPAGAFWNRDAMHFQATRP